jgi:hypothetical protein
MPDFVRDRGFAWVDGLVVAIIIALLVYGGGRISRAKFLVNYSLRARLIVAIFFLAVLCAIGLLMQVKPALLLALAFLAFALLVFWVLRDLASVGITNAFATTRLGVSADDSLRQVKRDLVFLGIGAKKLTESHEFDAMLHRCAASGGSLKFLLSSPDNKALEEMARRNGRDDLSYRSRVKESIREIFTRASAARASFEVRLYNLNQEIALPHFRLMFIDDRLCVFSQLLWSSGEGLDNPQLILRRDENSAGSSLYKGYRDYFDTLWDLDTTVVVTADLIADWPA